ncbi:MAG: hypothetical protein BZY81_04830 [SAR202 cluster bacterium Io17-Chloro-G4]|nr:MAG: hypothetical protein BZY81_04830 [SAR202 cluster bacterium Io17-Chloro-G4]
MKLPKIGLLVAGIGLMLGVVACAGGQASPVEDREEKVAQAWAPTALPPEPTPQLTPEDDTETLRWLAFAYWEALNAYEVEKTVSYLEDKYRQAHLGEVEKGIRQMKMFGVKLGLSEESAPRTTGPGLAEMYMTLKEPLGTRRILMEFAKAQGEWKITFAEEVE